MNDYQNGEILYCGTCNRPKEKIISVLGVTRKVRCVCKCDEDADATDRKTSAADNRRINAEMDRSSWIGNGELRNWTFANDKGKTPELTKMAFNYATGFEGYLSIGKGLLIYGPPGTGKTRAAVCIANAVTNKGYRVMVTNFAKIVNDLQADFEYRGEYVRRLNDYDLLVIDDLSTERNTEYVNEIVQMVIDNRYLAKKPLIVTTNIDGETFNHPKTIEQGRVISRLCERCVPIKAEGKDLRREQLNEQFKFDIKELKGETNAGKDGKEEVVKGT